VDVEAVEGSAQRLFSSSSREFLVVWTRAAEAELLALLDLEEPEAADLRARARARARARRRARARQQARVERIDVFER
jgi:RNase P/RNase MRP subunit p30